MKNVQTLSVVMEGFMEFEALGKNELVYLARGSYFGQIPFITDRMTGSARALADSILITIHNEVLYSLLLSRFKALRGYIRVIERMGLTPSETGMQFTARKTRIITVYGQKRKAGTSTITAYLATALSRHGKTIVLDASYSGRSIFDLFSSQLLPPLAQKSVDDAKGEAFVKERIQPVSENLHLLNVAYSSKVRTNPEILSPVIFVLSREYNYILVDCGIEDEPLRDELFSVSDIILPVISKRKERETLYPVLDGTLREGQRVYYILNGYLARDTRSFGGGYVFDDLQLKKKEPVMSQLSHRCDEEISWEIIQSLVKKNTGLVLESGLYESILYGGVLSSVEKAGLQLDIIYTSSYSFLVAAAFVTSESTAEYIKKVSSLLSAEKINTLMDVTFPDEFVFKNNRLLSLGNDIARDTRVEMFNPLPCALVAQENTSGKRIMSTGYLKDSIAASCSLYPVFEPVHINGTGMHSGYPLHPARGEDILRTCVDEILHVSIGNRMDFRLTGKKMLGFYRLFTENQRKMFERQDLSGILSDHDIRITVDREAKTIQQVIDQSEKQMDEKLSVFL